MSGPRQAEAQSGDASAAGLAAFDALVEVTRAGMEQCAVRPGDARAAALTAWSLVHRMAQPAIDRTGPLTPEDRDGITQRLRAAHSIMMEGLRPR